MLVNDPKAFPGAFLDLVKRGFRAIWAARGGGLYACGFLVVFVWLEVKTFFGELFGADSVGSFVTEQLFEFVIRFTVQSISNTIEAFLWPVRIIQWNQPWGFVLLAAMYLVFANFLKKPIEAWLFDGSADAEEAEQQ